MGLLLVVLAVFVATGLPHFDGALVGNPLDTPTLAILGVVPVSYTHLDVYKRQG